MFLLKQNRHDDAKQKRQPIQENKNRNQAVDSQLIKYWFCNTFLLSHTILLLPKLPPPLSTHWDWAVCVCVYVLFGWFLRRLFDRVINCSRVSIHVHVRSAPSRGKNFPFENTFQTHKHMFRWACVCILVWEGKKTRIKHTHTAQHCTALLVTKNRYCVSQVVRWIISRVFTCCNIGDRPCTHIHSSRLVVCVASNLSALLF